MLVKQNHVLGERVGVEGQGGNLVAALTRVNLWMGLWVTLSGHFWQAWMNRGQRGSFGVGGKSRKHLTNVPQKGNNCSHTDALFSAWSGSEEDSTQKPLGCSAGLLLTEQQAPEHGIWLSGVVLRLLCLNEFPRHCSYASKSKHKSRNKKPETKSNKLSKRKR